VAFHHLLKLIEIYSLIPIVLQCETIYSCRHIIACIGLIVYGWPSWCHEKIYLFVDLGFNLFYLFSSFGSKLYSSIISGTISLLAYLFIQLNLFTIQIVMNVLVS
jgi:hypothetical protein